MRGLDPHLWASARAAALIRDGNRCQAADLFGPVRVPCEETVGVHVHHVDPARFGPYDLAGLLCLCPVHHARLRYRDPRLKDQRRRRARANAGAYRSFRDSTEHEAALERRLLALV